MLRGNEGDLNQGWSWDGLQEINSLMGTVGEEIQVSCRRNSRPPYKKASQTGDVGAVGTVVKKWLQHQVLEQLLQRPREMDKEL